MIRQAILEDIPELIVLGRKFHDEAVYAKPDFCEESIRENLERMLDGHHLAAVWLAPGQGMIGLLVHPEWVSGKEVAAELFWWVLDKGNGVGGKLLDAAEDWVKACELGKLNLTIPYMEAGLERYLRNRGYVAMEIAMTKVFA